MQFSETVIPQYINNCYTLYYEKKKLISCQELEMNGVAYLP